MGSCGFDVGMLPGPHVSSRSTQWLSHVQARSGPIAEEKIARTQLATCCQALRSM